MTSLWKLCPKIWLYVYSSRQWTVCHLGITTSLLSNAHAQCVGNYLKSSSNSHATYWGRHVLWTDLLPLVLSSHLASKVRNWLHCSTCQAMASLKYLHVCVVYSSDIRRALTLFCLTVFHTHSHGKLSTQWCVNIFVQGIEISTALRSQGEMGYHSIMLLYSVSKLRQQCHVHRYVHSYKNTQLELCAGVWGDNHYAASVSLWHTELAAVNVCTLALKESGENSVYECVGRGWHGRVDHFLLFCNFIKEI